MSDIIVRFKPENHKELIRAIKDLQKAQGTHTTTTKKSTAATKKQTKANSGLLTSQRLVGTSFATLRSHMLLYSFGMSLGIRQTVQFAKQAAKIQQMEKGFTTMSGGVNNASIAIRKLKDATDGTLSSFDLFQQANNAMVLGVSKNSDEMADMFDMAQRLGDALGKDVKLSVESLVTGIGRQSRLMLDNIGIIVKADKAYKEYAKELGKTADTLTDSEKKQAFMNAALEAGREKLKFLPNETQDANKSFQQLNAAMSDLSVEIGKAFLPTAVSLADTMTTLANAFNEDRVRAYAKAVKVVLAGAMIFYRKQVMKAVSAQMKLGWGALIVGAGILAEAIYRLSGGFDDTAESTKNAASANMTYLQTLSTMNKVKLSEELNKQKSMLKGLHPEYIQLNADIEELTKLVNSGTLSTERDIKTRKRISNHMSEQEKAERKLADMIAEKQLLEQNGIKVSKEEQEQIENNIEQLEEQIRIVDLGFESYKSFLEVQDSVAGLYTKTKDSQVENLDVQIDNLELLEKEIGKNKELTAVLEMLKNKKAAILQAELQAQLKAYSRMAGGIATLADAFGAGAKEVAAIQAAGALVDAFGGASSARFNAQKAGLLPPIPGIMYAVELAAGIANARAVAMAANKVGSSSGGGGGGGSAPILSFEEGGYVGGNRHAQGGTIIEAERGEFVMSRNAVESIGLETLNQMNQGGGGSNINVSVTGNVLTQDFVEGELAESIKEAVRRGSDFGIG